MNLIKLPLFFLLILTNCMVSQTKTFTVEVSQSADDAEESEDGQSVLITSSDLEMVFDTFNSQNNQTIGIRFKNVNIPPNATIVNAHIQFVADGSSTSATNLTIKGEAAQNSEIFNEDAMNISMRTTTTAQVDWTDIVAWADGEAGEAQKTPDISSIVGEIIASNGWDAGNAVTFIITGSGEREAVSFDGSSTESPKLVIEYTLNNAFSVQVAQSSDDAEESEDGTSVLADSSDLEMVFDDFNSQNNQTVGIRFQNVTIPNNRTITNAYIQFWADETDDVATNLTIKGELAENSVTFSESANNISSRTVTAAEVAWNNIPEWEQAQEAGVDQRTPNLSAIVSEIIMANNWQPGNSLTFILSGEGKRVAEAYDGVVSQAPMLVIEYEAGGTDIGIDAITGIDEYNFVENDVEVSVDIQNYGFDPVNEFMLTFTLDNGTPVTETVTQTINPGQVYTHVLSQTFDLDVLGEHTLTVEVDATGDEIGFNDTIEKTFHVIEEFSNLYFGTNSAWKYVDDGSDLGTTWVDENFDDSSWSLGTGQFGFGENDEDTNLTSGHITYYFRKTVNIEDIAQINTVVMNLVADDAAVVYVNGQEVARSVNLPQGTITATTTATRSATGSFENKPLSYDLDPSLFNTGMNTLAIEIHNTSAGNLDLSFSSEVVDQPIQYSIDGPYVFHRNGEIIVKSITENGPVINTFAAGTNPTLTCELPNGDTFDFQLIENKQIPEPTYEAPDKFFVVSDIEGQIEAFSFLLRNAGVMDENYNWTYGEGHLYFIGDMFDRGDYVTQAIWLLYKLEQEARQAGGDVHFIVGNHEVINFNQDFRYVRDKYYHNAHYVGEMLDDMYNPDTELGAWFRTKNIIENAGESAIFVHAGISPQVNALNLAYKEINDYGRVGMDDSYCSNGNSDCQTVNGGSDVGVYWYRGIAREEISQAEVDNIITNFNGENMIIGHTVFDQVTPLYNDKVIAVDVDHGDNFANGYMEALHYNEGCYYRFVTDATGNTFTPLDPDCDNIAATGEFSKDTILILPNPVDTYFSVQYPNSFIGAQIYIYDTMGRLLSTQKLSSQHSTTNIDTATWSKGVYFVEINSGKESVTKKIIKK